MLMHVRAPDSQPARHPNRPNLSKMWMVIIKTPIHFQSLFFCSPWSSLVPLLLLLPFYFFLLLLLFFSSLLLLLTPSRFSFYPSSSSSWFSHYSIWYLSLQNPTGVWTIIPQHLLKNFPWKIISAPHLESIRLMSKESSIIWKSRSYSSRWCWIHIAKDDIILVWETRSRSRDYFRE